MFDISLLELLIIFIVSMLVLKPEDAISIFTKFKNFSNNPIKQDFLDFKEIDTIEEKENAFCFKDGNRKEKG